MTLENIVRTLENIENLYFSSMPKIFQIFKQFVRVNTGFQPLIMTSYVFLSTSLGLALRDWKIDLNDAPSLILSGSGVIGATIAGVMLQKSYKTIGKIIEKHGFYPVIQSKYLSRLAKVYAKEHDLIDDYNSALKKCS